MSSSVISSSSRGTLAVEFLFFKSVQGQRIFERIHDEMPQIGDILLFPLQLDIRTPQWIYMHAAVYCGEGEVIHFQYINREKCKGRVSKEGYHAMVRERGKCQIFRKKDGIDLDDFRRAVREAMNKEAEYSLATNNCIHFVLSLLGLADFSSELVEFVHAGSRRGPAGRHGAPGHRAAALPALRRRGQPL